LAGAACASIAPKLPAGARVAWSILFVLWFGSLSFAYVRPLYRPQAEQLRLAGFALNRTTPPNSLIVAADNGDSAIFYYAQRKGWNFSEKEGIFQGDPLDSEQVIADLATLRQRGATHLVLTANTFWCLDYYKEFAERVANSAT